MEYEQALIIGKRRRADAAMALGGYVREKAMEVCAVKPSKDSGLDARDWEPVGEESYPYIEVYSDQNGRIVLELEPEQVQVIGTPIPASESEPVSREDQNRNMPSCGTDACTRR